MKILLIPTNPDPFASIYTSECTFALQKPHVTILTIEKYNPNAIKYYKKKPLKAAIRYHITWKILDKRKLCLQYTANAAPGLPPPLKT